MRLGTPWATLLKRRFKCQQKTKSLRPDAERLTVEAHVVQNELLELGVDGHIGCDRPTQRVSAKRKLFEIREGREQLQCLGKRRSCATKHIFSRKN